MQQKTFPQTITQADNWLSIYIHWPYCEKKCPYCDFNSHVSDSIKQVDWQRAYLTQIDERFSKLGKVGIKSIFFGGGTPSLMNEGMVGAILEKINSYTINDIYQAEITLEANPSSVENKKLIGFKRAGVNRISVGIQSLQQKNLEFLGRKHNVLQAKEAIEIVQNNFSNYSLDFIYGLPNQSEEDWKKELQEILEIKTPHLSLYQLTIEKGTEFYSAFKKGLLANLNEEMAQKLMVITNSSLENKGFINYEISNFAKKGFESKHNLNYWQFGSYVGIGPGAHGRINKNDKRTSYLEYSSPEKWLELALKNKSTYQEVLKMNQQEIKNEILIFALRIDLGISNSLTKKFFSKSYREVFDEKKLHAIEKEGLIVMEKTRFFVSKKGRFVLHSIIKYLT